MHRFIAVLILVGCWGAVGGDAAAQARPPRPRPSVAQRGGVSGAGGGSIVGERLQAIGRAISARFSEIYRTCLRQDRLQQILGSFYFQTQINIPSEADLKQLLEVTLAHADFEGLDTNPECGSREGQPQFPDVCTIPASERGGRALIRWNRHALPSEVRDLRKFGSHEILRAAGMGMLEDFPGNTSTHYLVSECLAEVLGSSFPNDGPPPAIEDADTLFMHNIGVGSAIVSTAYRRIHAATSEIVVEVPASDLQPTPSHIRWGVEGGYANFRDFAVRGGCEGSALRCTLKMRWATPWTRILPAGVGLRTTQALSSNRDHWGMVAFEESPSFENLICGFQVRSCEQELFFQFLGRLIPNLADFQQGLDRLHLSYFPAVPLAVR